MSTAGSGEVTYRPIQHLGFLVDDIPAAVHRWVSTFGAGPFFWLADKASMPDSRYRGEPCVFNHSAVIGKWDNNFVELMQVHEIAPDGFREAFEGSATEENHLNHICYVVDDPEAEVRRLETLGVARFWKASLGPLEVSYCDGRGLLGHAIEIHKLGPEFTGLFNAVAAAAEDWDGSDPLRALPH